MNYTAVPSRTSIESTDDMTEQGKLIHQCNDDTPPQSRSSFKSFCSQYSSLVPLYIINGLLLILLISLIGKTLQTECNDSSLGGVYSPARKAVRYEDVVFKKGFVTDMSEYMGWPSDETDKAWEDLYKYQPVRVPKGDAHKLPKETEHYTALGHEDEYMVGIDVFHQLHCLNVLRRAFYPHRYPNLSMWHPNGTLYFVNWIHIDHCIESLRQSLQCSSDISPMTFKWLPERHYMLLSMQTHHHCRDFHALRDWAKENSYGEYDPRNYVENGKVVGYQRAGDVLEGVDNTELRKARLDLPDTVREGFGLDVRGM
ncbi:hypothetical protein BDV96DRAFT_639021 [Lophiotrema nucula]|uniref:Tat pathway signal sequence n=1 Tax=Lophiotrema nucula TaxID=690887 RepID=A0A6A5ZRU1_9PLEO|nr:hypothetical protein BDV96DRAFT_639021 [Lophiotrema nucula]